MIGVKIKVVGDLRTLSGNLERDIDKLQQEIAYRIVDESRRLMDESTPSGRVYRRGSIKGRRTKQGVKAGLRRSGKTRMIVGSRFHRASAPGQPPAEDTGRLYRSINVRRMAKGNYRVRFGGAAGYLEFGTRNMDARPFIIPAVEIAIQKTFADSKLFT